MSHNFYSASRETNEPDRETRALVFPNLGLQCYVRKMWLEAEVSAPALLTAGYECFMTRSKSRYYSPTGPQSHSQEGVIQGESLSSASSELSHSRHWAVFYIHYLMWERIPIAFRLIGILRLVSRELAPKRSWPSIQSYIYQSSEHVRLS